MPVADAQRRVSSSEFQEWRALDTIDPIGPERTDAHALLQAATVINVNRKRPRAIRLRDFMPWIKGPLQDPATMETAAHQWARLHNRRIDRKQRQRKRRRPRKRPPNGN